MDDKVIIKRITFSELIKQMPPEYIEILFDGSIDEL